MPNKTLRPIIQALKEQKWEVTQNAQGHWRCVPPDKKKALVHMSRSNDFHALKNIIKQLQASGFEWPVTGKKENAAMRRIVSPRPTGELDQPQAEAEEPEAPTSDTGEIIAALMSNGDEEVEEEHEYDVEPAPEKSVLAVVPPPASSAQLVSEEPLEARLDRLFADLKEARVYYALAAEDTETAAEALFLARTKFEEHEKEQERARKSLDHAKAKFDAVMSGSPEPKRRGRPPLTPEQRAARGR